MTATKVPSESLGSVWTVPAKADERVQVVKPDASEVTVLAGPDGALVVLDQAGKFSSGDHTVTAK